MAAAAAIDLRLAGIDPNHEMTAAQRHCLRRTRSRLQADLYLIVRAQCFFPWVLLGLSNGYRKITFLHASSISLHAGTEALL